MAYVDTNVLVAAYSPTDPMPRDSKTWLSRTSTKVVSVLTFLELSAVLARMDQALGLPDQLQGETSKRRIRAAVEYIFRDSGVTIASHVGASTTSIGGRRISVPMEYSKAASEAHRLRLKTLDLMHLAQAFLISRLQQKLDRFVTGDRDIIDISQDILESFDLRVLRPNDDH